MGRVVVKRINAHGLLRGVVGGKHRAKRGAIVYGQCSIDEYICAASETTHAHGCMYTQGTSVFVLTCELVSSPCNTAVVDILVASAAA